MSNILCKETNKKLKSGGEMHKRKQNHQSKKTVNLDHYNLI
ncbi:hypothetical protein [Clostridium tyrobutyricum]|nr:hypothetical protein [Clostridium tyrobutyricum]